MESPADARILSLEKIKRLLRRHCRWSWWLRCRCSCRCDGGKSVATLGGAWSATAAAASRNPSQFGRSPHLPDDMAPGENWLRQRGGALQAKLGSEPATASHTSARRSGYHGKQRCSRGTPSSRPLVGTGLLAGRLGWRELARGAALRWVGSWLRPSGAE